MPKTEADAPEHEFICEVCDTTVTLTNDAAYNEGWDYPPFMGAFGVVSARTCPNCTIDKTAWWAFVSGTPFEEMSERHQATVLRIVNEQPR